MKRSHSTVGRLLLQHQRQTLRTLRAISASFILTMHLFDLLPKSDARPEAAIVRELVQNDLFDPRELVGNGVVLTMPFKLNDHNAVRRAVDIGRN